MIEKNTAHIFCYNFYYTFDFRLTEFGHYTNETIKGKTSAGFSKDKLEEQRINRPNR